MGKEQNITDRFKGCNPFRVPDGYMEGLTERVMSRLPEKPQREEARKVTMPDRVRPWLYMAAVFAGLGLFFKAIVGISGDGNAADTLLVQSPAVSETKSAMRQAENEEYLEYIEAQFTDCLLSEEIGDYE